MMARNENLDFISINDFSDKCRICLKYHADMVDIFSSGISNQIMEVTKIKMSSNDSLPRSICQDCGNQLKNFHTFQCLAKESDNYLRTLLGTAGTSDQTNENLKKKERKIHKRLLRLKTSLESKENLIDDKMYIILVSEASNNKSQNEICIKDLDEESGNNELTDICRSLIKNRCGEFSDLCDSKNSHETGVDLVKGKANKEIYNVNFFIYNCSECQESFELKELLIEHLNNDHQIGVSNSTYNYMCPICLKNESDKNIFINHLIEHKKAGFLFFKVDKTGNSVPLTKLETEIFELPKLINEAVVKNKIFKVNTDCCKCYLCTKIESVNSITEHLKMCFSDLNDRDLPFHVKYTCPACSESWVDDIESMHLHLSSHRSDNVFFVKVNSFGETIDLTEKEIGFTKFEKALEILNFNKEVDEEISECDKKKIFKINDFFSCLICDFEAESAIPLTEHYLKIHGKSMSFSAELLCRVCSERFKLIEENIKYVEHLRDHKREGIIFVKLNGNGSVKEDSEDSDLFTDVNDLLNKKVNCPEFQFISDMYISQEFFIHSDDGCLCESDVVPNRRVLNQETVGVCASDRSIREYVCEKCGRKCFGQGNYKRHFTTHAAKRNLCSGSKRPSCSICNKIFSNRSSLNEHRRHHGMEEKEKFEGESLICEICGRRIPNRGSLAKHMRLHISNKKGALLKCSICDRGFRREPALNRHVSYHLNPNYFECEICKLPLPSSASLQKHKIWHEGSSSTHECKVCKLSFLTKDRLTAHQTHTGHHEDRKRFECNVCHEKFFVGKEFSQHIKLHPKYKMSECSLCGKRLSTMQSLMLHLSRHFESNSILCPHCGKQFFEERNYHRHLLTHQGIKPFSCDFEGCKKSFYTYFELNRHKKYHNNTRDFNCQYCPKSFHEANHLKVHIRTHTGERPYTCPHCNKGFVTRTRCKQHINLIHQGIGCDLIQSNISKKVAVFVPKEMVA